MSEEQSAASLATSTQDCGGLLFKKNLHLKYDLHLGIRVWGWCICPFCLWSCMQV